MKPIFCLRQAAEKKKIVKETKYLSSFSVKNKKNSNLFCRKSSFSAKAYRIGIPVVMNF